MLPCQFVRRSSLLQLFLPLRTATFFFSSTAIAASGKKGVRQSGNLHAFKVNGESSHHHNHYYAIFKRLLRGIRGNSLFGNVNSFFDTAVVPDAPLTANDALMKRLGVMDLTVTPMYWQPAASQHSQENIVLTPSISTAVIEACRAGVASCLPPTVVLRKIAEAVQEATKRERNEPPEWLPPGAAAVLLRCAAERVAAKTAVLRRSTDGVIAVSPPRDTVGWPRSDQGETARLRWALVEEIRCAYQLLAALSRCCQFASLRGKGQDNVKGISEIMQNITQKQYVDELRATLQLAAALQDHTVATNCFENLMYFCNTLCRREGKDKENFFCEIARDVALAISAFSTCRDFTTAFSFYERFIAVIPLDVGILEGGEGGAELNNMGNSGAAFALEKLRLFAALATCIDANAAHFTYLRDAVLEFFLRTDVGYHNNTRQASRETICALLHALSRVALEPHAKIAAAQSFFSTVQQNSHVEVCAAPCVVEALLQVASAARDSGVALLLYNRLAAPDVRLAEVPTNVIAILLSEKDALNDFARFLSFVCLPRRVISSVAVHLLAAKLILQCKPSETIYTILDLIQAAHEVEPQRVFFLRLVVFYRDLRTRTLQNLEKENFSFAFLRLRKNTETVIKFWRDELRKAGVTTFAFTTLQLLQEIYKLVAKVDVSQKALTDEEKETLQSLLTCLGEMLSSFSLGWLRHRAAVTRTPRYHLLNFELQRWINGDGLSDKKTDTVFLRTLRDPVRSPVFYAKLSPDELRAAVRVSFDALHEAANAENVVVLGFSDYVRLCWLEDASLMCTPTASNVSFLSSLSPSADEFLFSLDRLNSSELLVCVTDALGEMTLEKAICTPSSPPPPPPLPFSAATTATKTVVIQRDIPLADALADVLQEVPCKGMILEEKEWLRRWLEESRVTSHAVCGVFEQTLDRLLQLAPLSDATKQAVMEEEGGGGGSTVLTYFVSLDC